MITRYRSFPLVAVLCSLCTTLVLLPVFGFSADFQDVGHDVPRADPGSARTFALDRIIVKFRGGFSEPADLAFGAGLRFAAISPRQGDDLDRLNERFGVTAISPLFTFQQSPEKSGRRWRSLAGRRELFTESIWQAQQKFGRRSARAPQTSEMPDLSSTYVLSLPPGADIAAACRAYAANPNVEYAVPSTSYAPQSTVDDPYFWSSGSWGNSYDDLWGVKKVQADLAWNITRGAGVVVAVIDSGLDYTHPDIAANVWSNLAEAAGNPGLDDDHNGYADDIRGWHFDYNVSNNDVMDRDIVGHGTFVAGIIAAVGNNGSGIVGVAPEAKIMPVKIMENNGFSASEAYANGILYAAHNGADIINLSWGCSDCSANSGNPVVADAIAVARSLGALVVTSAGNWSSNAKNAFPAGLPDLITVSSTDQTDDFSSGSNRGFLVDVAAPGGSNSILSLKTSQTGYLYNQVGSAYLRGGGTSASAAFVSGVAALLLSANPALTVDQVTAIIRQSADDQVGGSKDTPGYDPFFGWGRVNAARAVAMAQAPPTDPPVLKVAGDGLNFALPQSLCGQERSFSVDIFNVGGGNLTWSLAPLSWLTPVPPSGTGNASPVVKIVADQPVSGDIMVTSNAAGGGTASLPVSVAAMPDIKLTNCSMALSTAPYNQLWDQPRNDNPPAVSDGKGGAYYVWDGYSLGPSGLRYNITLQHIDSNGNPLWAINGISISDNDWYKVRPTVISDGSGGAIVLWIQGLNTIDSADKNLAAQRVSSSGQLLWGSGGIMVTTGGNVTGPVLVTDNAGGALVGWTHLGTDDNIYAQRVSASGVLLWQSGGYPLSTAPDEQFLLRGVADGNGGAWFTWIDRRNPSHDVYGQHLDRQGTPLWPTNGKKLNSQSSGSTSPNLVSDGAGGAIVAWHDWRNYPISKNIYAIHLDSDGQDLWSPAEQSVVSSLQIYGLRLNIPMLEDGQGGAIIAWGDIRNGNTLLGDKKEAYAQRISGTGQLLWPSEGVRLLSADGYDTAPSLIHDNDGGLIAVWQDKRFGSFDIFLQQFSSSGIPRWGSTGLWAHSGTKDQVDPFLVPLGGNRLAITWNDWSNFFNTDIDFRGEIVQLCTDHDGDGFYAEGGVCGEIKATDPGLTIEATGPGRGMVQSLPSGISCGADCTRPFASGTVVTLKAVAAPYSHFAGWSGGGCSGNGDCTLTLAADTTVRAQFSAARPVKIAENNATIYSSPQQAYDNALSGNTIISWAQTFEETLNLNQPVSVELKGGYDTDFVSNANATTIKGALIISNGSAALENIVIQ